MNIRLVHTGNIPQKEHGEPRSVLGIRGLSCNPSGERSPVTSQLLFSFDPMLFHVLPCYSHDFQSDIPTVMAL